MDGHKLGNGDPVRPDLQTKMVAGIILFVFLGSIGWVGTKVTDVADRITRLEVIVEKNWESRMSWERRWEERFDRLEKVINSHHHNGAGSGK